MSSPRPTDSAALLEHAAWIRGLAHSLVSDPGLADDLAQQTCVAALEHPPQSRDNLRGWLRAVLVNFARQARRATSRRSLHEAGAARPESVSDASDVLARAAMHRQLVEAVMELSEPFRTTVLLRFFDGLPPRAIAEHLGIPVATVHSRLQRALARLRTVLDERWSDHRDARGAWVSALLPLAKQAVSTSPWAVGPTIGALMMPANWKLGVAAVLALLGAIGAWSVMHDGTAPPSQLRASVPVGELPRSLPREQPDAPANDEAPVERAVVAAPAAEPVAPAATPKPEGLLRGRVLDTDARPVWGAKVALVETGAPADAQRAAMFSAQSDAGGVFELPLPSRTSKITAHDERRVTLMAGVFEPGSKLEPVVVIASTCALGGRVFNEDNRPLAGARVEYELAPGFGARFGHVLDASRVEHFQQVTDAQGRFELGTVPVTDGGRLVTSLDGFESDVSPAPAFTDMGLAIVLRRPMAGALAVSGIVVAPDGAPVEGAEVSLGSLVVHTDASGTFTFDPAADQMGSEELIAVKRGFLPARLRAERESGESAPKWPSLVTLRLGGTPQRIVGRVVDPNGKPVPHIRVWPGDATFFGLVDEVPTHVESLLSGAPGRAEIERRILEAPAGTSLMSIVNDTPNLMWNWRETDERGEFELEGLLDRAYRLKAFDPRTLVQIEAGPFAAGSGDVTLVLDLSKVRKHIAGQVLSLSGKPVAEVQVRLVRRVMETTINYKGGGSSRSSHGVPGATARTDEYGRFELVNVPAEGTFLQLVSDGIVPTHHELQESDDLDALEIRVTARFHAQIELAAPADRADSFRILDEGGEQLPIHKIRGDDEYTSDEFPLSDGRSEVFAIAEDARTLVLYADGVEAERHELALAPRTLNLIRP